MGNTLYHRSLRVAALSTALVLLFDSGIAFPITEQLSDNTWRFLASSTGVVARVEPTELNTLTAELTAREAELDRREAELRNIEARTFGESDAPDYSTYILSFILFILTTLIVVNYMLDWRRARLLSPV